MLLAFLPWRLGSAVSYKLLIIRDEKKKTDIDAALPTGWRVMFVGEKIRPGDQGPFETIVCGCEMYTAADWAWYYAVVQNLRVKGSTKDPLWTN